MSLKKYRQKRKFEKTPEPKGSVEKVSEDRFVVQEHWASHHHFDFRLEMPASAEASAGKDVVLKSWAVPKGVPEKKGVKRLAIQTEDHPCSYYNFEGVIPEGYGAGTVKIFDKGKYELIERTKDRIVFKLNGKKLKGEYSLIKFLPRARSKISVQGRKPNQWLLFKTK